MGDGGGGLWLEVLGGVGCDGLVVVMVVLVVTMHCLGSQSGQDAGRERQLQVGHAGNSLFPPVMFYQTC